MRIFLVPLALFLAFGLACNSKKSEALKITSTTEEQILAAWKEGGLDQLAEQRTQQWKSSYSIMSGSDVGAEEAIRGFTEFFERMTALESAQMNSLQKVNDRLSKGDYVPENAETLVYAMTTGIKDGKTSEQRALEYAPRIEANKRKLEAHRKALEASQTALERLKKLS